MGEATYYAKIYYPNQEAAKKALPTVTEFLEEASKAYNYWQQNRHPHILEEDDGKKKEVDNTKEFWEAFKNNFPKTTKYLKNINYFGYDKNNGLAGKLDFGDPSDDFNPKVENNVILYFAEVWHFSEWKHMLDFLVQETEAETSNYVSDEYANYFDLI